MRGAGGGKPGQPHPDSCDRAFVPATSSSGVAPGLCSGTGMNVAIKRYLSRGGLESSRYLKPRLSLPTPYARHHGNRALDARGRRWSS